VLVTELRIRTEGRAHTYAGLAAPEGITDQLLGAAHAVDAVLALGEGLFEPLAVNIELACCDSEFGLPLIEPQPAARFHQLRLAAPPDTVAIPEIWEDLLVSETDRLDRATVLRWLGGLFTEQQCPEEDTTSGWAELIVGAVRARLPEAAERGVEGSVLPVSEGAGEIRYPVERVDDAFWVAGPLATSTDTSPFEVRIVNEGGGLSLDWSRHWTPWIESDAAGRPDVEAAVRRLSALGWRVRPGRPA
jgi:hypothetical protein